METFLARIESFDHFDRKENLDCWLDKIITNYIAYDNILARIEKKDWEKMCKIEAFDHIYIDDCTESNSDGFDIRVSKGPWKVDYTI
jgi:hypothetical protein